MNDVEAVVKRFKTELYNCVGFIQDPKKLKESVKELYQKYVQNDMVCQTYGALMLSIDQMSLFGLPEILKEA